MTINSIPATTESQKHCGDRLSECRHWVDEQLNIKFHDSDIPEDIKKFVFDMVASVVLYSQETTSAVFNYSANLEK